MIGTPEQAGNAQSVDPIHHQHPAGKCQSKCKHIANTPVLRGRHGKQSASKLDSLAMHAMSLAEGSTLEIIATLGRGWCSQCGVAISLKEVIGECPDCGSYQGQMTDGTEMRGKELEVA